MGGEGREIEGRDERGRKGVSEVEMKAPSHLNHADLPVGQPNETVVNQSVGGWVSGLPVHNVPFCLLVCQGDGRDLVQKV